MSAEPLLGPVDLRGWIPGDDGCQLCDNGDGLAPPRCQRRDIPREEQCPENWEVFWNDRPGYGDERRHLDWVIVGGESGPGARPMHPGWARSLRDQCQAAGVPFFFKQWGEWAPSTRTEAAGNPRSGWKSLLGYPAIPSAEDLLPSAGAAFMEHKGKSTAGRLLDGRTWDEMPEAAR